jgi:hypothetical protein
MVAVAIIADAVAVFLHILCPPPGRVVWSSELEHDDCQLGQPAGLTNSIFCVGDCDCYYSVRFASWRARPGFLVRFRLPLFFWKLK